MPGKGRDGRPIAPKVDPCEEPREIVVRLTVDPADVQARQRVVVDKRNDEVVVMGREGILCSVEGEDASFIADCLDQGFTFTGRVDTVSPDERLAVATVYGTKSPRP